jgi:hypothetical protein
LINANVVAGVVHECVGFIVLERFGNLRCALSKSALADADRER